MGENDAGRRLDRILRRVLKDNAQGAILSALRKGLVRLNGKKARAGDITKAGDLLSAASFLLGENSYAGNGSPKKAPSCPYPIVFQNENLLFIDKPAGTPTHGKGSVAETFAPQKTDSLAFVQAPLHRLDKGTSGLLAVSKSAAGARWFCKNIKDHSIKKFYWGITLGDLQKEFVFHIELNNLQAREGKTENQRDYEYEVPNGTSVNPTSGDGIEVYRAETMTQGDKTYSNGFNLDNNSTTKHLYVKLKAKEKLKIKGLQVGVTYKVTEYASDHVPSYSINDINNVKEVTRLVTSKDVEEGRMVKDNGKWVKAESKHVTNTPRQ